MNATTTTASRITVSRRVWTEAAALSLPQRTLACSQEIVPKSDSRAHKEGQGELFRTVKTRSLGLRSTH